MISQHYRKAFGALLVYDVTRKETFQAVQRFLNDLRQWSEPDCVIYLVGNKVDLLDNNETRAVPLDEVKEYSSRNKLKYIETSAYSDFNVNDCFYKLLEGRLLNLTLFNLILVSNNIFRCQ